VIAQNRDKLLKPLAPQPQGGAVLQKSAASAGPKMSSEYVQIATQNVNSSGTMQYLPHFSLAVAFSLLGVFAYRKSNEQKTFEYERTSRSNSLKIF